MDYKLDKLSNGLRVLTVPMPNLKSATLAVWVAVGSRFEEESVSGISHFLEHMAFKGGKKYKNQKEVAVAVDSIGGEFNAGTSKEWTNFYIRGTVGSLETAFDVLSDMIINAKLDKEDIEREKGVICEEISMYEDTPSARVGDLFERVMFESQSLGRDVIGTKETVRSIQKRDFVRYRKSHYFADNMLLTVSGGVGRKVVTELADRYFGGLEKGERSRPKKAVPASRGRRVLLQTKKSDQAHFILGFPGYRRGHEGRYAEAILATILGGGMSSRLFMEVRERRGLAYAVRCDQEHFVDTGYFAAYAGVVLSKTEEAIKVVLDEFYKMSLGKAKVSDNELRKAKEFLKGHIALSLENTKAVNSFFSEQVLYLPRVETPKEVFEKIDRVTADDVEDISKELLDPRRVKLSVIGPFDDEERFTRLLSSR